MNNLGDLFFYLVLGVVGFCFGLVLQISYDIPERTNNLALVNETLETNAEIMDAIIAINSRINVIQDQVWRVGHYTNKNHIFRPGCPECFNTPEITTQEGIEIASQIPLDELPDTMETVSENADEILTMLINMNSSLFAIKATNDVILDNLREKKEDNDGGRD